MTDFSSPHPHEPATAPVLDAEGRCLVCAIDMMVDVLSEAAEFFVARDEMNAKVHLQEPRWSPITSSCQNMIQWWRDWRYPAQRDGSTDAGGG